MRIVYAVYTKCGTRNCVVHINLSMFIGANEWITNHINILMIYTRLLWVFVRRCRWKSIGFNHNTLIYESSAVFNAHFNAEKGIKTTLALSKASMLRHYDGHSEHHENAHKWISGKFDRSIPTYRAGFLTALNGLVSKYDFFIVVYAHESIPEHKIWTAESMWRESREFRLTTVFLRLTRIVHDSFHYWPSFRSLHQLDDPDTFSIFILLFDISASALFVFVSNWKISHRIIKKITNISQTNIIITMINISSYWYYFSWMNPVHSIEICMIHVYIFI